MTTTNDLVGASAGLAPFRDAGVLAAEDVHVAAALARLAGEHDPTVLLAAALAVRAPRLGHVCVDLTTVASTVAVEDPALVEGLVWPAPAAWCSAVAASAALVDTAPASAGQSSRPLVLEGSRLYLERYWDYERRLAEGLRSRAAADDRGPTAAAAGRAPERADDIVDALLGADAHDQRRAVTSARSGRLCVIAGGPGTGKTTTVVALLAALLADDPDTRIAVAAPTGKAAARVGEAIRAAVEARGERLPPRVITGLGALQGSTLHRLLGRSPGSASRFRHDRERPLPHDVVVVDETSMVSLPLMAKLLDAVRPDARLVLVGDPDQLASVEAGAVLGDLTAAADDGPSSVGRRVVHLQASRRFGVDSPIGRLAAAVRAGDVRATLDELQAAGAGAAPGAGDQAAGRNGSSGIRWVVPTHDGPPDDVLDQVVAGAVAASELARRAADDRELAGEAFATLSRLRVLCAHRRGPFGVSTWNRAVEQRLHVAVGDRPGDAWYPGRPVLVTENDYRNELFNGDLGIVVRTGDDPRRPQLRVAFDGDRLVPPGSIGPVETVHAMTIHKSQGSEFDEVIVVLPQSRLATRELLYTAITRARRRVTIVGTPEMVAAAVERRVERSSGLRDALARPGVVPVGDAGGPHLPASARPEAPD